MCTGKSRCVRACRIICLFDSEMKIKPLLLGKLWFMSSTNDIIRLLEDGQCECLNLCLSVILALQSQINHILMIYLLAAVPSAVSSCLPSVVCLVKMSVLHAATLGISLSRHKCMVDLQTSVSSECTG